MEKESAQRIRRRDGPWGWYGCFHRITRYSLLAEYAASRAAIITHTVFAAPSIHTEHRKTKQRVAGGGANISAPRRVSVLTSA